MELDLSWSKSCITSVILETAAVAGNLDANSPVPDVEATRTTGAIFQISSS